VAGHLTSRRNSLFGLLELSVTGWQDLGVLVVCWAQQHELASSESLLLLIDSFITQALRDVSIFFHLFIGPVKEPA